MSKLQRLKFVNDVSSGWKVMFELYDWIRWSNENGHDSYADYFAFMRLCEDEILRLNLTIGAIPRYTNQENFLTRWFILEGKFKNIRDMKKLVTHDEYKIFMIRRKVQVRFKDDRKKHSTNHRRNKQS